MRGGIGKRCQAIEVAHESGDDGILWLAPRSTEGASRRPLIDRVDRLGTRVGRVAFLVACGFAASGLLPGAAFAPVSHAHAALAANDLAIEGLARLDDSAILPVPPVVETVATAVPDDVVPTAVGPSVGPVIEPDPGESWLKVGSRSLPRRIVETIVQAAATVDVDPTYLLALADKESSFRPDVKASTSSAQGLFQFIDRTWLEVVHAFGPKHGLLAEAQAIEIVDERPVVADEAMRSRILLLRRDPAVAARMAAEMLRRDAALIGFQVGRALTPTELYLAHFLGLQDAARFIALRQAGKVQSAIAHFPAAARANTAIFFERARRGRRGLSVPEVYARLDRMIDSRVALFREVREAAAAAPSPGV